MSRRHRKSLSALLALVMLLSTLTPAFAQTAPSLPYAPEIPDFLGALPDLTPAGLTPDPVQQAFASVQQGLPAAAAPDGAPPAKPRAQTQ